MRIRQGFTIIRLLALLSVIMLSLCIAPTLTLHGQLTRAPFFASRNSSQTILTNNASRFTILNSITLALESEGIAVDTLNHNIFVTVDGGFFVINGSDDKVIYGAFIYGNPVLSGIAYDPVNNLMYAASRAPGGLLMINATTFKLVGNISVGGAYDVVYDPAAGHLFVSIWSSNLVKVVDPRTNNVISNISVAPEPLEMAYVSKNGNIYVVDSQTSQLTVINTSTNNVVDNIAVGNSPYGVAYNPTKGVLYVSNRNSENISIVSVNSEAVISNITTRGYSPQGLLYDQGNGLLFVTAISSHGSILIFDKNNTLVQNLAVGSLPSWIAADPYNGQIYASGKFTDQLYVIGIPNPAQSHPIPPLLLYLIIGIVAASTFILVAVLLIRKQGHKYG